MVTSKGYYKCKSRWEGYDNMATWVERYELLLISKLFLTRVTTIFLKRSEAKQSKAKLIREDLSSPLTGCPLCKHRALSHL
jgi:hypothetical protein